MRSFSLALPCSRSKVHLTSAAVNGLPSCHLTPCRRGKVSSVPSSFQAQAVARSGTIDRELFCATCWSYITRLLKTPIIGRSAAIVDSSRIDMLAGLSNQPTFRIPPAVSANAVSATANASDSEPTAASTRKPRCMRFASCSTTRAWETHVATSLPTLCWALVQGDDTREVTTCRTNGICRVECPRVRLLEPAIRPLRRSSSTSSSPSTSASAQSSRQSRSQKRESQAYKLSIDFGPTTAATFPSSLPMFATFHCIAKRASTIRRIHPAGAALLARPGCPTLTDCRGSGVRFRDLPKPVIRPSIYQIRHNILTICELYDFITTKRCASNLVQ